MSCKKLFFFCSLFITVTLFAQDNFSYLPQNPKPGDVITISYEPAGLIAGSLHPVIAKLYMMGNPLKQREVYADELPLEKKGSKYSATIKTDTSAVFIYFSFSANKKVDDNGGDGYYIILTEGEKPKRGAYNALSEFYMGWNNAEIEKNSEKSFSALEKELAAYPEDKSRLFFRYASMINSLKNQDAVFVLLKEIESLLKSGLKTEEDYQAIESVYNILKLPEQSKLITSIKKEKFPKGKWVGSEYLQNYFKEEDPAKAAVMLKELIDKTENDPVFSDQKASLNTATSQLYFKYMRKKDWNGLKSAMIAFPLTNDAAFVYNEIAWEMQKDSSDLEFASELSRKAVMNAKSQIDKPTAKKPAYLTTTEWIENRKFEYAQYADTYAMVFYRKGDQKNAYKYSKDAIAHSEGKSAEHNNTYALVAEKVLPSKQLKKELEGFVRNGKSGKDVKETLKRLYLKEKKSDVGFDEYITALEKEQYMQMLEKLRKSMINEPAPSFALLDLNGNKVNISDLKGKVVVVDFWATWCGPCIASFPGMQKMVNKYKDDPDVKFVFIDTWEEGDEKNKKAAEFINKYKYSFQVLMDNNDKVVEQYKVSGIPTKFVIDKNGFIRFKSVGFDGDQKLMDELTAMIDMATKADGAKTF